MKRHEQSTQEQNQTRAAAAHNVIKRGLNPPVGSNKTLILIRVQSPKLKKDVIFERYRRHFISVNPPCFAYLFHGHTNMTLILLCTIYIQIVNTLERKFLKNYRRDLNTTTRKDFSLLKSFKIDFLYSRLVF